MQTIRRKDFSEADESKIEEFLHSMSFGFLSIQSEEVFPFITPLNFVYYQKKVYFHGSRKGHKMSLLQKSPRVSFAVADEYALIPSWFSDPKKACPATSFFKSVILYGTASIVEDDHRKARALQAFMEKLQPEGGFEAITPDSELYKNDLKSVALVGIEVEHINAKFKFGQNLQPEKRENLSRLLKERNQARDTETIAAIESSCPYRKL